MLETMCAPSRGGMGIKLNKGKVDVNDYHERDYRVKSGRYVDAVVIDEKQHERGYKGND